jgi:hypothetical protein
MTLAFNILDRDGEDKLWWSLSHKGKFDVRSFYKILAYKETTFPLEKYLPDQGSFKSGRFRLGDSSRENPYFEQSQKEASHCD